METAFTRLIGCSVPIQQAGMGGVATPELAAAVANAGGLGMVSMVMWPPGAIAEGLDGLAKLTSGAFGINFLMPFVDPEAVTLAASRVRLVEFFYGDPDPALVDIAHTGGALAGWQVGSSHEAQQAVEAGCDLVIAQGVEAGGHVRGETGLLPLLDQVLDTVQVPVVATGGIGTARAIAAALAAGAAGVRLGTRFVAAAESAAHPEYVQRLIDASSTDTTLTEAFSVMWPNAPHRVLRSCIEAANSLEGDIAGEDAMGDARMPIPKFSSPCPTRATTGHLDAMALYAGQSVDAVRHVQPAAEIVRELADGAERLLRQVGL